MPWRALAVVVALLGVLCAPAARASGGPPNALIAFNSDRDGDWEIFVVRADGSELRKLTDNSVADLWPAWSPDGTKIAFYRGRALFVMAADGTSTSRLTTPPPGHSDAFPRWSPDGKSVLFARSSDAGVNCWSSVVCRSSLVIVDVDTGQERAAGSGIYASWSPDGSKIVLADTDSSTGACETTYGLVWGGCHAKMFSANADGSGRSRLGRAVGGFVRYSPDGSRIAYDTGEGYDGEIVVMNADGSSPKTITAPVVDEGQPAWVGNRHVVHAGATPDDMGSLFLASADGGKPSRLKVGGGNNVLPDAFLLDP